MASSNAPISFEKEKIIAVEGKDDKLFFERLLEKLGISDIQVWNIESKGEFKNKFPDIQLVSGFPNVKKVVPTFAPFYHYILFLSS